MIKWLISQSMKFDVTNMTFQWGRTLLAASTLFTLLATDAKVLFAPLHGRLIDVLTGQQQSILQWGLFNIFPAEYIWISKVIAIISLLFVISGYLPRVAAVLHWYIAFSFCSACLPIEGGDQINMLLVTLLIPMGLFDSRKNSWIQGKVILGDKAKIVCTSFYWIMRLQVAMIYFQACTAKFAVTEWANGTATWYWFTHATHGMPSWMLGFMMPILASSVGVVLVTWGALVLEGGLAMALFMDSKFRQHLLIPAILFHAGIMFVHGLSSFFLSMSGALVLYLAPAIKKSVIELVSIKKSESYYEEATAS